MGLAEDSLRTLLQEEEATSVVAWVSLCRGGTSTTWGDTDAAHIAEFRRLRALLSEVPTPEGIVRIKKIRQAHIC